jgi:hypothetical protein
MFALCLQQGSHGHPSITSDLRRDSGRVLRKQASFSASAVLQQQQHCLLCFTNGRQ